ncbi:hypothetical protein DM860_002054 [Cuscuta australis]|uniref:alcohol dehydrogenase n=1 Tax=Cuscuta australis TaxID=267555 RepID=A0A328E025_9ASTE|nr:hypothetical protein DM860_002054 [Cuscuta australis]
MANPRKIPATTAGKIIKCKAAVLWGPRQPLRMQEVEVAPPQKMEVRVKILFTSVCPGDIVTWSFQGPFFPMIMGHEATGVVESVGEGVTGLVAGDTVMTVYTGECGECAHCKSEESNLCSLLCFKFIEGLKICEGTPRFLVEGKPAYHYATTSTFTEYTVCPAGCVVKINRLAPLDKICALSCGVVSGLGSVLNVARPTEDSSVAIFGLGLTGLAAAEAARIAGASQIICIDVDVNKLRKAVGFGMTYFLNPPRYNMPIKDIIVDMTRGGADRSVDCTGDISCMRCAFECVHKEWGIAVLNALSREKLRTDSLKFAGERTLKGCYFGNYKPRSQLPSLVDMVMKGELDMDKFITYRFRFAEINEALLRSLTDATILLCIVAME